MNKCDSGKVNSSNENVLNNSFEDSLEKNIEKLSKYFKMIDDKFRYNFWEYLDSDDYKNNEMEEILVDIVKFSNFKDEEYSLEMILYLTRMLYVGSLSKKEFGIIILEMSKELREELLSIIKK